MTGTIIGVAGSTWRGTVTPWGAVELPDGSVLDWWVAADDRWHTPSREPSVRQRTIDGTPVVETRLRVPSGDVVQRVYAAATTGGITVLEFENDSPLPVAIAVSSRELRTSRPLTETPVQGIELPAGSAIHPLGHRAVLRLGLAHDGSGSGPLPAGLPSSTQVVRGWLHQLERASRLVLPDERWSSAVTAARVDLVLGGLDDPEDDPVGFLLGVQELVRLGTRLDWAPEIATAATAVARRCAHDGVRWDDERALLAAAAVFVSGGDRRAAGDVEALRARLGERRPGDGTQPDGIRVVSWVEDQLLRVVEPGVVEVFPEWFPTGWDGNNFECYRIVAGPEHLVSFAVRWHGEYPALLWEIDGPSGLLLRAQGIGSRWSSSEPAGETLLTER